MADKKLRPFIDQILAMDVTGDDNDYLRDANDFLRAFKTFAKDHIKDGEDLELEIRALLQDRKTERAAKRLTQVKTGIFANVTWSLILMPVGFAVVGLLFVLAGISMREEVDRSEDWPSVEGQVQSSRVEKLVRTDHGSNQKGFEGSRSTTSYHALINYTYTVDGETHQSDRYAFDHSVSKDGAEELVRRHPAGARIRVYYDPDDPRDAVLKTGSWSYGYIILGLGVLFLFGAGYFVFGFAVFGWHKD